MSIRRTTWQTGRVDEAMSHTVVVLHACQTMGEAAHRLTQHQISAAPVVDESGKCIGMLSTTDFAQLESRHPLSQRATDEIVLAQHPSGPFQIEHVAVDSVRAHMSPAPQSIRAGAPLLEAARMMHAQHLRHLIVLDSCDRPVGILSTHDLLGVLVEASY